MNTTPHTEEAPSTKSDFTHMMGWGQLPGVFVAWTQFQRRQVSMAPYCNFETVFMPVERKLSKLLKAMCYLRNAFATIKILRERKASVLWIQLPQVPLLWVALLYRLLFDRKVSLIADCHNAMFRPPWSNVPFGLSLLSRCDIVVAHNSDVLETAVRLGVNRERLMVVEDPPASFPDRLTLELTIDLPRPWLVFPASFAADEPIAELLAAAKHTPEVSFLITGNVRNCRDPELIAQASANTRFMGFLSRRDFEALIQDCDAVIAFTRFDGVQLSVCGEAVGAGKPMLISNTGTLQRQFPVGTVFVNSADPEDIVRGVKLIHVEYKNLGEHMRTFHEKLQADWVCTRANALAVRIASLRAQRTPVFAVESRP